MKPKSYTENLDELFGIEPAMETQQELVHLKPAEVISSGSPTIDLTHDLDVVRRTLHNLIEKGNELVDNANFFAKEKQDSRSVEAASIAQKETRDTALALINMHKTVREIDKITGTGTTTGDTINQTAVFIGTTSELIKQMRELNANGSLNSTLNAIDVKAEPSK